MTTEFFEKCKSVLENVDLIKVNGKVTDVTGLVIVSTGPNVALDEVCKVVDNKGNEVCKSEVVGFKNGKVLSIALGEVHKISPACEIISTGQSFSIPVGNGLLGRVIDGMGNPIDGKGEIKFSSYRNIYREPPNPLT